MEQQTLTKPSLTALVYQAVLRLGECSVKQVVSELGDVITPQVAMSYGRTDVRFNNKRWPRGKRASERPIVDVMERGRRGIIGHALQSLCKGGKIERIRRGYYKANHLGCPPT